MKLRCKRLLAAFLLGTSHAVCNRQPSSPLHWKAYTFLPGLALSRGCSVCSPAVLLTCCCCLRLGNLG